MPDRDIPAASDRDTRPSTACPHFRESISVRIRNPSIIPRVNAVIRPVCDSVGRFRFTFCQSSTSTRERTSSKNAMAACRGCTRSLTRSFLGPDGHDPDVATVYALQDAAQARKGIAGNLPRVHGMSPNRQGAARRKSHGKIVLRVA